MALAIAIIIAAIGVGYAMSRVSKIRKELPEFEKEKKPKRKSKREKRLEQIRAVEPEYVPPSIDDLIAEEIGDLGIDQIPGAEGLAPGVALKVYRRDTLDADDCLPGERRFVIADGIDAADAGSDDVKLVCVGHPATAPSTTAEPDSDTPDASQK